MNLIGGLSYNGDNYFVICKDTKYEQEWYVINRLSSSDRLRLLNGEEALMPPLDIQTLCRFKELDGEYIIEGLKRSKTKGIYSQYGNLRIITKILEHLGNASAYAFKKGNIIDEHEEVSANGKLLKYFEAYDNRLRYKRITEAGLMNTININFINDDFNLQLRSDLKSPRKFNVELKEIKELSTTRVLSGITIKNVTMDILRELVDLSFYEDPVTLEKKKDYRSIKTIAEFEKYVIGGIIEEYRHCQETGEEFVIAVDTETTGFNVYNLAKENPHRDHIVAVPMSWKDNQGVVVFIDMEYFENVPAEYFFNRIKQIVEGNRELILATGKRSVPFILEQKAIDNFNDLSLNDLQEYLMLSKPVDSVEIARTDYTLTGHNVMYDGCAFMTEGVEPWWDDDSLQIAFDLNPKVIKGKIPVIQETEHFTKEGIRYVTKEVKELQGGVSLKNLTRRLFGHETPELSDVLGKGNEDKYRYLRDEEVAILYGCADGDYSRLVRKALIKLMGMRMYKLYKQQDVPLLNKLYHSQFEGLYMDEKRVLELADNAERDRELIKKFLQNYVGRKISFKSQYEVLEAKYKTDKVVSDMLTEKYNQGEFTDKEYKEGLATLYTKDKFLEEAKKIKVDHNAIYEFEMKGSDYRKVMYEILKYPIYAYTKGDKPLPSTDKYVMKKLMRKKAEHNELKEDVMSSDGKTVLISAKEFNSYRYPLAYVLSVYGSLNKEYTSYFKPIKETNLEGKLFKNYSLARIETRRIMNPSQTMKGSLKALTQAYNWGKDWYMFDFDMAQVEYRIMVSIAGQVEMVERLRDPEKDFHTESASALSGIPAYKIEKKFRKKMKAVHFGIPYGLGDKSMCESMNGTVTPQLLVETRMLSSGFKERNDKVIAMLEEARDNALTPDESFSDEFKRFAGFVHYTVDEKTGEITEHLHKVGAVRNKLGFYRLFDLENLDAKTIASIRRMAGNYPIQCFAAELFRMILINFYRRCYKEGIDDKIKWHMLIHDELLGSAHKSVNPFFLYKLIKEECMVTFKGHTNYFVGINIGDNWAECKDDASEAPVLFVNRMVKRWDAGEFKDDKWVDNAKEYVNKYKAVFIKERIHEVLLTIQPTLDDEPIDAKYIFDHFENYTVRAYLSDEYIPKAYLNEKGKPSKKYKDMKESEQFEANLTEWANEFYEASKSIRGFDGHIFYSNVKAETFVGDTVFNVDNDDVELEVYDYEDGGYWSFDDDEFAEGSFDGFDSDYEDNEEEFYYEENHIVIDEDKVDGATSVSDMIAGDNVTNYVHEVDGNLVVSGLKYEIIEPLKRYLKEHVTENEESFKVVKVQSRINHRFTIERYKVTKDLTKEILNTFILTEYDKYRNYKENKYTSLEIKGEIVYVRLKNLTEVPKDILGYLRTNKSTVGYNIKFVLNDKIASFKYLPFSIDLKELDNLLINLVSLTISKTTALKHIKDRVTYINIDVTQGTDDLTNKIKRYLKPFVSSTGKLVRFQTTYTTETWLKIKKDTDLNELDNAIDLMCKNN